MPTVKDKIVIGSTYSVKYECLEPSDDAANPFSYTKTPKNPTSATADLWNVTTQSYVPLGPANAQSAPAQITGNVVTYTLPAYEVTEEGDYKLVITVNFADGQIVRDIRPFKAIAIT